MKLFPLLFSSSSPPAPLAGAGTGEAEPETVGGKNPPSLPVPRALGYPRPPLCVASTKRPSPRPGDFPNTPRLAAFRPCSGVRVSRQLNCPGDKGPSVHVSGGEFTERHSDEFHALVTKALGTGCYSDQGWAALFICGGSVMDVADPTLGGKPEAERAPVSPFPSHLRHEAEANQRGGPEQGEKIARDRSTPQRGHAPSSRRVTSLSPPVGRSRAL